MRNSVYRSQPDLSFVDPDTITKEELAKKYNKIIDFINFFNKNLSFNSFDGTVKKIEIEANNTGRIYHYLGTIPKYRIILTQEGNGVISDISSEWTESYITIRNNGTEKVTLTLLISKE